MKTMIKAALALATFINRLAEAIRRRAIETAQAEKFKALEVRANKEQKRLDERRAVIERHGREIHRLSQKASEISDECEGRCAKATARERELERL